MSLGPLWLSAQLALTTALILLLIATPLAWWLARTRSPLQPVVQALATLPIVLPPTVLGFYLLLLLGPAGAFGGWWLQLTGDTLTFSFAGLVIASCVYSLPFAVQPLQTAFQAVPVATLDAARTLGAAPLDTFFSVAAPLARRGFVSAFVLSFAHTLGEFGVVLMVGGNIAERTRVVSIAIYDHVESLHYAEAHTLSLILVAFAFTALLTLFVVDRRWRR